MPRVALISQSNRVTQEALSDYVTAYQAYVDDWLARQYQVRATIVAPVDGNPPTGAWIMYFKDGLQPGDAGYHVDTANRPTAYIDVTQGSPQFTGSHELAEMLVDPAGNSLYVAPSPDPADHGRPVEILEEVCDPCEDPSFAISVAGVQLSGFITSSYGNGTSGPYDVAGKLAGPRTLGINGYVSWVDGDVWKQATNFKGQFQVRTLGSAEEPKNQGKSLREWVDEQTRVHMRTQGIVLRL